MTGTQRGGTSSGTVGARDREILRLAVPAFLALVGRAAVPALRRRHRRPPRHPGARRARHRRRGAADGRRAVRLPGLRHHRVRGPAGRRRRRPRRARAGRRRGLAGGAHRHRRHARRRAARRAAGRAVRPRPRGGRARRRRTCGWRCSASSRCWCMLAGTGILRGLQDTRTPLVVAVAGNLANIALNVLLVYGLDLGIAGSAIGSDLAQLGSAAALVAVVVRAARREGAALRPDLAGVRRAAHAGVALVVRTLTLRASLLVMTYGAATLGATSVATHQLASTIWTFLAFALDAVAIAAQALTGRTLGAGELDETRAVTDRMVRWGLVSGVVTAVGLAAHRPAAGWAVHRRPAGARPAVAGAAGGRRVPAGGRRGVRARRRADRRRRRPLPGVGRRRGAGGLRAAGLAGAAARRRGHAAGTRRWSGCGSPSGSASWAAGPWCCCAAPAAPAGWSPAPEPTRPARGQARGRRPPAPAYFAQYGDERRPLHELPVPDVGAVAPRERIRRVTSSACRLLVAQLFDPVHTIRAERSWPDVAGDGVHLHVGVLRRVQPSGPREQHPLAPPSAGRCDA